MNKILFLLGFLAFIPTTFSYSQQIDWLQCYGGTNTEYAYSIKNTFDAGLVFAGSTMSNDGNVSYNHGQSDCWIVKLDYQSDIQWEKSFGGTGTESAYTIQPTKDKGYIFAGATNSEDGDINGNHGFFDIWVVKIDYIGNILWQKCLGGENRECAYSVAECLDGGYILAGYTLSDDGDISINHGAEDAWVIKLDTYGNLEWEKTFGGNLRESASVVLQTPDKGYIIGGTKRISKDDISRDDAWIVKMDSLGNMLWEETYGGLGDERIKSLVKTSDDGFVFAASCSSNDGDVSGNHGSSDYWLVKINNDGKLLWQKCFGGSSIDDPNHLEQSDDSGFIISGHTWSNDGDIIGNNGFRDGWVIKIDSLANLEWQKCFGGIDSDFSYCTATLNTDVFILGYSNSNDGIFTSNHGEYDSWISKLSTISLGKTTNFSLSPFVIYPNPSKGHNLTLSVRNTNQNLHLTCFNTFGRKVYQKEIYASETRININSWQSGIYLAVLHENGIPMGSMKFVVQ